MRFGLVSTEDADGAILAHTLRVADGVVFKKGRRLSGDDVAALRHAGITRVTVARLEPSDVHEDKGAQMVAAALAGEGAEALEPSHGRCNVVATVAGLPVIDPSTMTRGNLVDEAITVATVSPGTPVEPGDPIATVKIIPFGVPRRLLHAAVSALSAAPLRVAAFRSLRVGILVTERSDRGGVTPDRAIRNLRGRIERLRGTVTTVRRCEHEVSAVSDALRPLLANNDLILMHGISAIVDRGDVFPQAIMAAGGTIDHLGLPVDPGTLMLLAHCDAVFILGVPGCARSLRRSGFDQVLERTVAGLPVDREARAAMGVGGLLRDTHPRVRRRPPATAVEPAPRIAGVVLAAGRSARMGSENKLLADLHGRPLLRHVVDTLTACRLHPLVVVTGFDAERIRRCLQGTTVRFVDNPDFADGMSGSVRAGVDAVRGEVDGMLIALGDMAEVTVEQIARLTEAFVEDGGASICVPVAGHRRGNPVLWPARYAADLMMLDGDQGARPLLSVHADAIREVEVEGEGVLHDVDTMRALLDARARPAPQTSRQTLGPAMARPPGRRSG